MHSGLIGVKRVDSIASDDSTFLELAHSLNIYCTPVMGQALFWH